MSGRGEHPPVSQSTGVSIFAIGIDPEFPERKISGACERNALA
jgi:hypothetical protein